MRLARCGGGCRHSSRTRGLPSMRARSASTRSKRPAPTPGWWTDCYNGSPPIPSERIESMPADIIVTAPLPDFLYGPLKADYRCHDYHAASDKGALLATAGPVVRGL